MSIITIAKNLYSGLLFIAGVQNVTPAINKGRYHEAALL